MKTPARTLLAVWALTAACATAADEPSCPCVPPPLDNVMMAPCSSSQLGYLPDSVDTCIVATGQNFAMYPPDYGTSCKPNLEVGFAACFDQSTKEALAEPTGDWCTQAWCYVDGCTCGLSDVDGGQSAVLTHTDGRMVHAAYSYSNCGNESDWDPVGVGQASYDTEANCDQPCACVPQPPGLMSASCTEDYATMVADGVGTCVVGGGTGFQMYPGDYGETCKKHLEPGFPSCFNLETNAELAEPTAAFCNQPWCYVDGCTCDLADVAGGPSSVLMDWDGKPPIIAYSYALCGDDGDWDVAEAGQVTIAEYRRSYCDDPLTCGYVRDWYGASGCCGMPDKVLEKPAWR